MFILNEAPVPYTDPWLMPAAARLQRTRKGSQRVAYLYHEPDNSTFRYRVYNMIQALELRPDISATYFTGEELASLERALPRIDVLVVGRYRYTHDLNRIICKARDYGKRVFFDVDDLIFDLDYLHLIVTTLDQDVNYAGLWDTWFAMIGRLGATLKLCEAAITTNEYLAERIRRFAGKPVLVIPNFMNREQLLISRRIYQQKLASGFARDGRIHVGYFSGTPTHNRDLELAASALYRLLLKNRDVVLRVVGYMELKDPLRELGERIERLPFHDFINLQRCVGEVELNLMPLQDNEFTNCKSELKYFEAGIAGTVSIASPVFTYRQGIKDGVTGYLAHNHQWEAKLDEALRQLGDYRVLAERAYADCEQRYAYHHYTDLIAETLFSSRLTLPAGAARFAGDADQEPACQVQLPGDAAGAAHA